MADDRSGEAAGKPGTPTPAPTLPERARIAAGELGRAFKGFVTGQQDALPADHEASPHTPDASGGGDASDAKARGKSLSATPSTFKEWLQEQRQSLADHGFQPPCHEDMEPDH